MYYEFSLKWKNNYRTNNEYDWTFNVSKYYGITLEPITKEIMIIMPYYNSGDLMHYITNDFYNISWYEKLGKLKMIINGLVNIHSPTKSLRQLPKSNR